MEDTVPSWVEAALSISGVRLTKRLQEGIPHRSDSEEE